MGAESIFYNGLEFTNETFNAKKLKDTNTDITVAIISFNQQQIDATFDNIDKKRGIDDFYTKSKYKPNEIKYFTSFVNSLGVKFGLVIVPSWNSYRLGVAEYSSLVFDTIGGVLRRLNNLFNHLVKKVIVW